MISLLFVLTTAFAVPLPALPAGQVKRLPVEKDAPLYACAEVPAKLAAYDQMARQHDQSVSAFLGEVSQKLNEWYDLLTPFEGKPAGAGSFEPLAGGAAQVSLVTDLAWDNTELLASEMDRILRSLEACSIQKK